MNISAISQAQAIRRQQAGTDRDGDKEDARAGEKAGMVEALPYRVSSSYRVCVQPHLSGSVSVRTKGLTELKAIHTSVSNQNLFGNCRKIFVYVA